MDENRKKIWIAFSDLYLDTDVTLFYDPIAKQCVESGYCVAELRSILFQEVAPVCGMNLFSVAGVWDGWDEEWLISAILQHREKKGWLYSLFCKIKILFVRSYTEKHWATLQEKIAGL